MTLFNGVLKSRHTFAGESNLSMDVKYESMRKLTPCPGKAYEEEKPDRQRPKILS